jgi:hypothetical protein
MKIKRYLIPLTIASMVCTFVQADEEKEIRFYEVEVVIFKNDRGPKNEETILPVSSPRFDDEILDLSSPLSIEAARQKLFVIIPTEELRLNDQVISIVKSDRYSLLAHAGWRQPGLEKETVMPIWIKGGRLYGDEYTSIDNQIDLDAMLNADIFSLEDPADQTEAALAEADQALPEPTASELPASESTELDSLLAAQIENADTGNPGLYELEGKITITLARYLHTSADLVLRKPRLSIEEPALDEIEVDQLSAESQSDTRILNNHSLKESRRMRSSTLHYLDSPELSMLVLITPYEAPEEVETTDPESVGEIIEPGSSSGPPQ